MAVKGERLSALKPNRVACSAVKLEECVSIAGRAMTKVGALGKRPRGPYELAALDQELLQLGRRERRIGKTS
jgi:hypothetical protein